MYPYGRIQRGFFLKLLTKCDDDDDDDDDGHSTTHLYKENMARTNVTVILFKFKQIKYSFINMSFKSRTDQSIQQRQ